MRTTVRAPDGGYVTVEHPDGASEEQILSFAQENYKPTPVKLGAEGMGDALKQVGSEQNVVGKFATGLANAATRLPSAVLSLPAEFGGPDLRPEALKNVRKPLEQATEGAGVAGTVGDIAGSVALTAPLAVIPGAATLKGSTAIGAGVGGIGSEENRVQNALLGGALSGVTNAVTRGVSRTISPKVSPEVRALIDQHIRLTPGQIAGGAVKRAEESLKSVPVVGQSIRNAEVRASEDFNRAALNRALAPLGESLPKNAQVGHEVVEQVGRKISQAYDSLLPKLNVVADQQFGQEVAKIHAMSAHLPEMQAKQFESILRDKVIGKFTSSGRMSGETMKEIESELGRFTRMYGRSENPDHRLLGDAFKETQSVLRRMVERGNPQYADELTKINEAYANLLRVENAAGRLGSKEGVFSPSALKGASRAMDSSLRKRSFSRGNALMQDLAESGERVLGSRVPDSGSPERLMTALLAGGAGAVHPGLAAGVLAGPAMYSPMGQRLAQALMTSRPAIAEPIGKAVNRALPYSPLAAALATQ